MEKEQDNSDGVVKAGAALALSTVGADMLQHLGEVYMQSYYHTEEFGWVEWVDTHWEKVSNARVVDVVRQAVQWDARYKLKLFLEVKPTFTEESKEYQEYAKAVKGILSLQSINGYAKGLQGGREVKAEKFDRELDLLNVANGVVDLRTGELLPHDPKYLFTKITQTPYIPDATHPDWDTALEAVPEDVRSWLLMRLGQGLTGHRPSDQTVLILKGVGSNGKSTILDAVRYSARPFVRTINDRVLMAASSSHPTELMQLLGTRLAFLEELAEGGYLNAKRLKDVTVEELTARYIAKDFMEWQSTHTVVIATNYTPKISESDLGTWRRLALVNFPYQYKKTQKECVGPYDKVGDPGLSRRLIKGEDGQREAILASLVRGAIDWYANDSEFGELPGSVQAQTTAWRASEDPLVEHFNEFLIPDSGYHIPANDIYAHFDRWRLRQGGKPWGAKRFNGAFREHEMLASHNIVSMRLRVTGTTHGTIISRDPVVSLHRDLGNQYSAWVGLRFNPDAPKIM